jgi:Tol biopolymer transport system component
MKRLCGIGAPFLMLAIVAAGASAGREKAQALLTYVKAGKHSSRVCFARPDGSHQRLLFGGATDQDWSPDGRFVVFYRPGEGFVRGDAEGHVLSRLVGDSGRFDRPWHPRWSPTTDWIALTDGAGGGSTLLVVPAGGGTPRVVLSAALTSFSGASWLRDGRHLIFSSAGGFLEPGIYTVTLEGSDLQLLLPGALAPEVSPDGSLAYLRRDDHNRGALYVSRPDGSEERRLSRPGEDVVPLLSWSPDGRTIAFTRARDHRFEIVRVRADDAGERTLLAARHASYAYPAWRRASSVLPVRSRPSC